MNTPDGTHPWLVRVAPALFVLVWATGFVVAKFGLPYAAPLSFLSMRFILTLAVLLPLIMFARAGWPNRRDGWLLVVAGVLVRAGYLGGVWCAIKMGMPAGVSALIGPDGKVRKHWARVRDAAAHPEEVLEALRAE